jgi:type IV pilus assembly protein PilB
MALHSAGASAAPADDDHGDQFGLIAPTQRGRSRRFIGDVIVDLGLASRHTVDQAIATARDRGKTTGQILLESGTLSQSQLARALGERLGMDYVDLSIFDIDMGAVNLLSCELARRYQAVPVGFLPDRTVVLAMADPTNIMTLDEISMITGMELRPAAATLADVLALIAGIDQIDETVNIEAVEPEPEAEISLDDLSEDAPAVKLVHSIVAQAIQRGASDIHWNPESTDMEVLFRIDGMPTRAATVARGVAAAVVSRIKIMASLDIAERRVSQDGRLALTIEGRRVDLRVVTLPLINGEGVVMRILDTQAVTRDLASLGMQGAARDRFAGAINKPYGAVLVTGPTGSGKSTTMYSALHMINNGERTILTIEDPVESAIAGIKQMQVSLKTSVTFAGGLRSILRADPDVIMVGEIRDHETARIAVQAALTGHLVLSTLHTRDAPSAITRMIDMGIEPFLVSAAIDCVVAQRLVRTLCAHCKCAAALPAPVRAEHGLEDVEVFEPGGCIRCGWSGYDGRVALFEVMPMTDELRTLTLNRRDLDNLASAAARSGMRTLTDDGIDKVRQGLTSLVEIGRVTATL